jgi:PTS system mannose-specific IIB component
VYLVRGGLKESEVIVLNRIDSRLIHGQVIEAWVPHLHIGRVVVADDDAAADPLTRAAFDLAMPPEVEVVTTRIGTADFERLASDRVRTLVLFRTVHDAELARTMGLPNGTLNVGNVHRAPGKVAVSRSVFLDAEESLALSRLKVGGMEVVIQAIPEEAPVPLP